MKTVGTFIFLSLVLLQGLRSQDTENKAPVQDSIHTITANPYRLVKEGIEPRYSVGVGIFIPQGTLENYIGVSPLVEVALHIPAHRNHAFDLAVQFVIPNQTEDFIIPTFSGIQNGQSFFMSNYVMRFNKNLLKEEKKQRLEIGLGLGASTLVTSLQSSFIEQQENLDDQQSITTFLVMPSIKYRLQPFNNTLLTMGIDLQYSPYRIKGALEENIGGLAISPRVTYSF